MRLHLSEYCDWYIELKASPASRRARRARQRRQVGAALVYEGMLKLLHPLHALRHRGHLSKLARRGGEHRDFPLLAPRDNGMRYPEQEKLMQGA